MNTNEPLDKQHNERSEIIQNCTPEVFKQFYIINLLFQKSLLATEVHIFDYLKNYTTQ